ncbi:PVC-type heme-binding CxxCH protein [Urbifossiella limnaea]|uniref:Cytochrome c n=1 Tax=Urbifossiella limnaea TaxID=2528023 RepID=A0A517XZ74_9BACT|nr:PVC-type heme-binding CxxCH protein [Urbifossiella limnaea]QDU22801.1 Cytochrome c [Urbifossiella limnaea]
MRRFLPAVVVLLTAAAPASAQKEFGFDNRKASGQPYLSPDETAARMKVLPEFEAKLFAGEPQLANPIAFTIDEKGRVWCVECFEYPSKAGKRTPRDRIVILEDTDGDGRADKRTVFCEGKDFPVTDERKKAGLGAFDMASGIEVGHGGVFVGAPPYLWFIENKNDKPGKFDVLLSGFGSQDTHETLNTFQWGPDGWLYGLHGVFTQSNVKAADGPEVRMNAAVWRYHPTRKTFEIFSEGTSNPWGMDWRNTDGQFILACCVIPHLYHMVPGGTYKRQAGASFNPHAFGQINEISDHTFHKKSGWAHAGLISLDVPHMPEKYRNSVVFGSIHGCSFKQNVLKANGSSFVASEGDDFLVSGDKNFRPINMRWGPNGDIYVIDWHDQNPCHQAKAEDWDYERGRVYRIQLRGTQTKKADDLGSKSSAELAKSVLASTNPWEYRTALRLLQERPDAKEVTAAQDTLRMRVLPGDGAAVRAAWLSDATRNAPDHFNHPNPVVRSWSIRLHDGTGAVRFADRAGQEANPVVRREWASFAARRMDANKEDGLAIIRNLMKRAEDANDPQIPHLLWLAYEKTIGKREGAASPADAELAWLAEQAPTNILVRDQIVPRVMRRLVATGHPDDLDRCVRFVASLRDVNSREKALDGLAVGLAGRTAVPPPSWARLLAEIALDNNPRHVPLVNKLAVSFRDPAAIRRALDTAKDAAKDVATRAEAVRQLGTLRPPEAAPLLLELVKGAEPVPLRAEAARALAGFDNPKLPDDLLAGWKGYPREVRADVVTTLASRKEGAKALLGGMSGGKVDRAAVTDNTILRIQAFNDRELNALIEKAWGRTRPTPVELNATIDKTRASFVDEQASFARGRAVFEANCAKCHKFDGKGAEVGPPLEGAARDIEYILTNVIDPNRVIGAPYFLRTARLLDGTVSQGVLHAEDEKSVTLKLEQGVLKTIAKADLDGPLQTVERSLMPEGLGYNMTPQDFRDLVRYLMANPFLTSATVNGTAARVGVDGRIPLPDTKGAPAVVEARVTAPENLKLTLLVGASSDFEVRIDGKAAGVGKGSGERVRPDEVAIEVTLAPGEHTVTIAARAGGGAVYARFADPDRKLRYPDAGEKK